MSYFLLMFLKTSGQLVSNITNLTLLIILLLPDWLGVRVLTKQVNNCNLMMIEKGIRGGITHISKRYSEANSKYMKYFNPDKPTTFIQYLDVNNLYGWAMSQRLPADGFKWLKGLTVSKTIEIFNQKMSNHGYIFEIDLEYPKKLWISHNDCPLAQEKLKIDNTEKLDGNFYTKGNYVLHCFNLKQYLILGMKLTVVHRGIKFKQFNWMKPHI